MSGECTRGIDEVSAAWHVAGLAYSDVTVTLRDGSKHRGMVRVSECGVASFVPDMLIEFLEACERLNGSPDRMAKDAEQR